MPGGILRAAALLGVVLAFATARGNLAASNASVAGRVGGADFTFSPARAAATFTARAAEGELLVVLCQADCPNLGGSTDKVARVLSLTAHGATRDLRGGQTFEIGRGANALAQLGSGPLRHTDEAIAGEVVIVGTDLREGGHAVGTFQLSLGSGGRLKGFFEVPLLRVQAVADRGTL